MITWVGAPENVNTESWNVAEDRGSVKISQFWGQLVPYPLKMLLHFSLNTRLKKTQLTTFKLTKHFISQLSLIFIWSHIWFSIIQPDHEMCNNWRSQNVHTTTCACLQIAWTFQLAMQLQMFDIPKLSWTKLWYHFDVCTLGRTSITICTWIMKWQGMLPLVPVLLLQTTKYDTIKHALSLTVTSSTEFDSLNGPRHFVCLFIHNHIQFQWFMFCALWLWYFYNIANTNAKGKLKHAYKPWHAQIFIY